MTSWDSQHYLSQGRAAGIDETILLHAEKTANHTLAVNPDATVILSLGHLAHMSDVPYDYLRRVAQREKEFEPYRVFSLERNEEGCNRVPRIIYAPEPLLLRAQRWIHGNVLAKADVHDASTAYGKDCSVVETARRHCEATWLIKMDVSNFFESILEPKIYPVFRRLGYQPLVAFELTRLCTWLRSKGNIARRRGTTVPGPYIHPSIGHLPQGAPTSPMLANLVAFDLDEEMTRLAKSEGLRYTRYADDITLSFIGEGFSREKASAVIGQCHTLMTARSLWPNRTKTRVIPPGVRKIVLGLLVDGERPALTREFRSRMRQHLYYLETLGPSTHAANRGFDSVIGLQNHLFGLAAYALGVDRGWGREVMSRLRALPWPTFFEMPA